MYKKLIFLSFYISSLHFVRMSASTLRENPNWEIIRVYLEGKKSFDWMEYVFQNYILKELVNLFEMERYYIDHDQKELAAKIAFLIEDIYIVNINEKKVREFPQYCYVLNGIIHMKASSKI